MPTGDQAIVEQHPGVKKYSLKVKKEKEEGHQEKPNKKADVGGAPDRDAALVS